MRTHLTFDCRSRRGVTLVELMIAVTLGTIVLAAVIGTFSSATRHFKAVANYGQIHAEGRIAVDRFAQDFRKASDVTSWGASTITLTVPTSFTSAGVISQSKSIRYYKSGNNLIRQDVTAGTSETLSNSVQSLTFTMYDRVGASTSLTSSCKGVQVDIRLRRTVQATQQTEDFLSARLMSRNKP